MSDNTTDSSQMNRYRSLPNVNPSNDNIDAIVNARDIMKTGWGEQKTNRIIEFIPRILEMTRKKDTETRTKDLFQEIKDKRNLEKTEQLSKKIQELNLNSQNTVKLLQEMLEAVKGLNISSSGSNGGILGGSGSGSGLSAGNMALIAAITGGAIVGTDSIFDYFFGENENNDENTPPATLEPTSVISPPELEQLPVPPTFVPPPESEQLPVPPTFVSPPESEQLPVPPTFVPQPDALPVPPTFVPQPDALPVPPTFVPPPDAQSLTRTVDRDSENNESFRTLQSSNIARRDNFTELNQIAQRLENAGFEISEDNVPQQVSSVTPGIQTRGIRVGQQEQTSSVVVPQITPVPVVPITPAVTPTSTNPTTPALFSLTNNNQDSDEVMRNRNANVSSNFLKLPSVSGQQSNNIEDKNKSELTSNSSTDTNAYTLQTPGLQPREIPQVIPTPTPTSAVTPTITNLTTPTSSLISGNDQSDVTKINQPLTQDSNVAIKQSNTEPTLKQSNESIVNDTVRKQEVLQSAYKNNPSLFANRDLVLRAKSIVFSGDEIEVSQVNRARPTSFPGIGGGSGSSESGGTRSAERTGGEGVTSRTGSRRVTPISGMDDVKAMIIEHEGIRYEPYQDSEGKWTIGVGHLIGDGSSPGPYAGRRLSHAEVMQLFEEDFARHVRIAEQTPGWSRANQTGQAAMIDLAFNMGQWWTRWPNTARALESGDWEAAAQGLENSKWYRQVGRRAPRIVNMIRSAAGNNTTIPPSENSTSGQMASMVPTTGGETPTPTASGGAGGASRPVEGGGAGTQVMQASQENAIADRTPAEPAAATSGDGMTPSGGGAGPGTSVPEYYSSANDPGNVEPADAAERYARLFNMAA